MGENKRVYTVEEIQAILSIGKNTAYALVKSGVFHSVKVGGQYRISKKHFDEWLDAGNRIINRSLLFVYDKSKLNGLDL